MQSTGDPLTTGYPPIKANTVSQSAGHVWVIPFSSIVVAP